MMIVLVQMAILDLHAHYTTALGFFGPIILFVVAVVHAPLLVYVYVKMVSVVDNVLLTTIYALEFCQIKLPQFVTVMEIVQQQTSASAKQASLVAIVVL